MDLRVLVLVADPGFGELVRAQVDNLGCATNLARTYDEGSSALTWADAAVVDLTGDGLDDLNRLRVEAPTLRVLAIAPDDERAESARSCGASAVLVEPFAIPDIVTAMRQLAAPRGAPVIDLRAGAEATAAVADDDAPWFSTR
ncbi:MAG: hypothetical protein ACT452_17380 [Microthrixaceae bacterium]